MTISLLDNYKLKAAAFLVCARLCQLKALWKISKHKTDACLITAIE